MRKGRQSPAGCAVELLPALALAAAVCWPSPARAESELWLKAGVRHLITREWRVAFDQHLRWAGPVNELVRIMPELSGQYRPTKYLRFELGYRFSRQLEKDEWEYRHRLHLDSSLKLDLGPLALKGRARLQNRSDGLDAGDENRTTLRPGAWVSVDVDGLPFSLEPGLGAEAFVFLDHPKDGVEYQKLRLEVFAEAAFGPVETELSYRMELPADEDDPTVHIIGLSFGYDL